MSSSNFHASTDDLSDEVHNMHQALSSLTEELQAIDLYNQRACICKDKELKAILMHNRDEEKEHASMLLEWIRRKDPKFSGELKNFLFTEKMITHP